MTQSSDSSQEMEIRREIENYEDKRKRVIATFLIGMFGMYVIPFRNLFLVLAIIAFGIAPSMTIYYTWRKHQLEKELEEINLDTESRQDFPHENDF